MIDPTSSQHEAGGRETPPGDAELDGLLDGLDRVREAGGGTRRPFFGHYYPLELIGRGGQASVYLAQDLELDRVVALKVLSSPAAASEATQARFEREGRTSSRLDHPGICTVYEVGCHDGAPFIAMQYVEGETLQEKIKAARDAARAGSDVDQILAHRPAAEVRGGVARIDPRGEIDTILELVEAVARTAQAAHERGVVHRDLKPGNIMVTPDGMPVILDFGLAADQDHGGPTLTETGALLGTPAYMSPEQIGSEVVVDHRTDVFTLGVTLYECLTLRRPFDSPTREALYRAILSEDPPSPLDHNPALPRDLAVVLQTALAKGRDRRYLSARAFADDLRRVRERRPIHARPAGTLRRASRWVQRNPRLAMGLMVFVLTVSFGQVALVMKNRELSRQREAAQREAVMRERILNDLAWINDIKSLADLDKTAAALAAEIRRSRVDSRRDDLEDSYDNVLDQIDELEGDIQSAAGSRTLENLRRRLELAGTIESDTVDAYRDVWDDVIDDVARHPAYGGLELTPQVGLIPLGRDPLSGLHEFLHYETNVPGCPVPQRREDGSLDRRDGTGLVMVLVPGRTSGDGPAIEPFFLSKYEMTSRQWRSLTYGLHLDSGARVNWHHCVRNLPFFGLLLPTVAQWEHAATDGKGAGARIHVPMPESGESRLPHALDRRSWTNGFGFAQIYDDVQEWCQDEGDVVRHRTAVGLVPPLAGEEDGGVLIESFRPTHHELGVRPLRRVQ